ncbi:pentapeptide repeat-containing protein [Putridiphycobacter roseus]|uniref:Pentapeptide repeat-containing protein n=1 Tax=Putridiphycobacter roseus TaxID=2219161 RepID=A0A2W1MWV1_9FLAO|nr:pentapeptide repeat-containing protein [Putridiphycobacter roseus]PZE16357.1 pentapeptide repeat-containing protein [Putridiphycobacter roseus]
MRENETIKGDDFSSSALSQEYENCQFLNCDFTGVNLSNVKFITCEFEACNFTQTKWNNSSVQSCEFVACKMLGLDFSSLNPFLIRFSFENCQLNFSSFFGLKIKGTPFINCQLQEVDFSETDLSKASFAESDLKMATFDRTNLIETDFRTAINFSIDPTINKMKKAKFASNNLRGLLDTFSLKIT